MIFISLIIILISGCGSSKGSDHDDDNDGTEPRIVLNETFDSYNIANWTAYGSSAWSTILDSSNTVIQNTSNNGQLIYNTYTGNIRKVSVRVKPSTINAIVGIVAFWDGSNNYYTITIDGKTATSYIVLRKYVSGNEYYASSNQYFTLDTSTWYTITFEKNNDLISCGIDSGTTSTGFVYKDVMELGGVPEFTSGKVGIIDSSSTKNSLFDDLIITGF